MIIQYSDNNENRIYWQHRKGEEWKTAELDELIEAYERATEPGDLISRESAMNIFAVDLAEKDRQVSYQGFCIDAVMAIDSLPSAEKKGKWRDYPIADGCLQCSNCGVLRMGEPSNYCPNCGARMVEE